MIERFSICEKCGAVHMTKLQRHIIDELSESEDSALTGAELARRIGVTPAAIFKATKDLLDNDILDKKALPQSHNVKMYSIRPVAAPVVKEEAR